MKDGSTGRRRTVFPALKRCKISSSSIPRVISIDHLPGDIFVEILARLGCYKSIFGCRCVSKRWCNILSDPYFIGRFLRIQSERRSPVSRTLINSYADEFIGEPSVDPGTVWGERFSATLRCCLNVLDGESVVVVATYKDLILCCVLNKGEEHLVDSPREMVYYICNPYLKQWVALPPTPVRLHKFSVLVGFICEPSYEEENVFDWKQQKDVMKFNNEYRYKVVRIHPLNERTYTSLPKFRVEIFSSDTGEWKDSVVSSLFRPADSNLIHIGSIFAYNGKLYWDATSNILVQLDPFSIGDTHQCRIIECLPPWSGYGSFFLNFIGENRKGCAQMCHFHRPTNSLVVWELGKQEKFVDDNGILKWKHNAIYSVNMGRHVSTFPHPYAFDPSDEDILYLCLDYASPHCYSYNIHTGAWSRTKSGVTPDLFPLELPWWPTPVHQLPLNTMKANGTVQSSTYAGLQSGQIAPFDYFSTRCGRKRANFLISSSSAMEGAALAQRQRDEQQVVIMKKHEDQQVGFIDFLGVGSSYS